jgi:hypothetical protein
VALCFYLLTCCRLLASGAVAAAATGRISGGAGVVAAIALVGHLWGGFGFEFGFKKRRHFVAPRRTWVALVLVAAVPVLVVVRIALVSVVVAVGLRVVRQDVHLLSGCVYGSAGRGVSGLQRDFVEPADRSVDERARRTWGVPARIRFASLHLSGRGFPWGDARRHDR